jgi:hypothetical protein
MFVSRRAHVAWKRKELRGPAEMLSEGQASALALRRDRILRRNVGPDPGTKKMNKDKAKTNWWFARRTTQRKSHRKRTESIR